MTKATATATATDSMIATLRACFLARVHCLLMGRPGISKTTMAMELARQLVEHVYSIVLPEDTPVAELRGHYLPSGSGTWNWHDGPVTAAVRNGGIVILDELSHLSPEAVTFMHAALDRSPITLPNGETVAKHPNFWAVATMNDGDEVLRDALRDRFSVRVKVLNPPDRAYSALPGDLQAAARAQVEGEAGSLRPWYAYAALRNHLDHVTAADLIWPGRGQELINAIRLSDGKR